MYLVVVWQSVGLALWMTELRGIAQSMAMRMMLRWPTMVWPQLQLHSSVYDPLQDRDVLLQLASR